MYICPKCPFIPVSICKHLGEKSIRHLGYLFRALGVPLSPKCLFAPSAHLPWCPFVNILGKWAQGTWDTPLGHLMGTPFPQMSIFLKCPFASLHICKHLRGNGHWNIRALRVSFSPNVHLPQCPFPQ